MTLTVSADFPTPPEPKTTILYSAMLSSSLFVFEFVRKILLSKIELKDFVDV